MGQDFFDIEYPKNIFTRDNFFYFIPVFLAALQEDFWVKGKNHRGGGERTAPPPPWIRGLTLVMMGGGLMCPPRVFFIFLLKISPPDQTLRPTCKFLILGILYHDFFFFWKFSI